MATGANRSVTCTLIVETSSSSIYWTSETGHQPTTALPPGEELEEWYYHRRVCLPNIYIYTIHISSAFSPATARTWGSDEGQIVMPSGPHVVVQPPAETTQTVLILVPPPGAIRPVSASHRSLPSLSSSGSSRSSTPTQQTSLPFLNPP